MRLGRGPTPKTPPPALRSAPVKPEVQEEEPEVQEEPVEPEVQEKPVEPEVQEKPVEQEVQSPVEPEVQSQSVKQEVQSPVEPEVQSPVEPEVHEEPAAVKRLPSTAKAMPQAPHCARLKLAPGVDAARAAASRAVIRRLAGMEVKPAEPCKRPKLEKPVEPEVQSPVVPEVQEPEKPENSELNMWRNRFEIGREKNPKVEERWRQVCDVARAPVLRQR